MKTPMKYNLTLFLLFSLFCFNSLAQTPPNLNTTSTFGVLSGGNITATDFSFVNGDAGAYGTIDTIITIYGSTYANNVTAASTALNDLNNAIADCNNQTGITLTQFNDTTLSSAVYTINGSFILTDTLTLQGNENSVFIFNISDSAYFAINSFLYLDGVYSSNIFFNVANNLWLDSNCVQSGIFLVGGNAYLFGENYSNRSILTMGDIIFTGEIYTESFDAMESPHLNTIYEDEACNLDYVSASVKLNLRADASGAQSVNQPAIVNVNIPSNATIRKAFVWFAMAGRPQDYNFPPQNINFGFRDPGQSPNIATATRIAASPSSTCWQGFQRTSSYRADVTTYVINNFSSIYEISQLPVSQIGGPGNMDTWGATLLISYTLPCLQENFWGYIHISDGLRVNNLPNTISTDITNIPTPLGGNISLSKAFLLVGDLEMPITTNSNTLLFQGIPQSVSNPQMWNFIEFQPAPGLTNTTTQYSFTLAKNSIDCHNFSVSGVYYRTTNQFCTLTQPPAPIITGTPSACNLPDIQTYEVTNILQGATYNWTAINGTPAAGSGHIASIDFNDYLGGSITFTVTNADGCESSSTFTVYPCCVGDLTLTNKSTSTIYQDILINGSNSPYDPYFYITGNQLLLGGGISSFPTTGTDIIAINGTLIVDHNLDIHHTEIILGPDAKIEVQPGIDLRIVNVVHLHSCGQYMWDGIHLTDNTSYVLLEGGQTFIEDAINAVVSYDGGVFDIYGPVFNKNYKNVVILPYNQPHTGSIRLTTIKCTDSPFASPGNPAFIGLPPHSGKRSFTGVVASNVNHLKIGEEVFNNNFPTNYFYNLDFGIICNESNMDVFNNTFESITSPNSHVQPPVGAAILARGLDSGTNNLNVGGPDVTFQVKRSNHFHTCHRGIDATLTNMGVDNNTFDLMTGHAVIINANQGRTMNLINNAITNSRNGFRLTNIENAGGTIQDNSIELHTTSSVTGFTGVGIHLGNAIAAFTPFQIRRNMIFNANTGIFCQNINNVNISDNNPISFNMPTAQNLSILHNGIWLQFCLRASITNNNISRTSFTPQAQEALLVGINLKACLNNRVIDNSMTRLGTGIRVRNNCDLTQFRCNLMNQCYLGTFLDAAILPTQGTSTQAWDNLWTNTMGPWKVRGNTNAILNWYYQGAPLNDFDPAPHSVGNSGLNNLPSGPNPDCSNWLLAGGGGDPDYNRDVDFGAAVADTSFYADYETEFKYYEKQHAFSVLNDSTDLLSLGLPTDFAFQQFYNDMQQGNIGALEAAKIATMDADYPLAWQKLTAVADTALIESNMKWANETYLDFLQSGADTLTATQEAALLNLAYQPSLTHGEGVFMARGILGLMVDVQVSSSARMMMTGNKSPEWAKVRIWPNPAQKEIKITFDKPLNKEDYFLLYNQTGYLVSSHILPKDKFQFVLNISDCKPGIYFGKLMSNGEYIFDKIVVVK